MAHNRKLVLAGAALTQAKLPAKQTALAMGQARDEIEQEILSSGYLETAPFKWVGLIIRQGLKDESRPHYKKSMLKMVNYHWQLRSILIACWELPLSRWLQFIVKRR